jgi:hypothetical protein
LQWKREEESTSSRSKNPPSKKVALNCTHWALDGRKIGMMEKWKEILINCRAIFQYSNKKKT